jgi:hypothetical protein
LNAQPKPANYVRVGLANAQGEIVLMKLLIALATAIIIAGPIVISTARAEDGAAEYGQK